MSVHHIDGVIALLAAVVRVAAEDARRSPSGAAGRWFAELGREPPPPLQRVPRPRRVGPSQQERRAAALADLRAGLQPEVVALRHRFEHATVQRWRRELSRQALPCAATR